MGAIAQHHFSFARALPRIGLMFTTYEFWTALSAIVLIDVALAGDNAIAIALAARNLPKPLQRRAMFWGAFAAVAVRATLTAGVLWLLRVPGLMAAGGLVLLWIAYRLITGDHDEGGRDMAPAASFAAAVRTIVIADAMMGLENVLAVAGAAHGSVLLVVLGLLISIPIIVSGSAILLRLLERFPQLIYIGGAVLAWTAAKMIVSEPLFADALELWPGTVPLVYAAALAGVLGLAWLTTPGSALRRPGKENA
jgi:YjbE family integral membrane protein